MIPFAIVTTAGFLLLREERMGLALSIVAQSLQIIFWSTGAGTWRFSAGLEIAVLTTATRTNLNVGANTTLLTGAAGPSDPTFIGINLVPVAVVLMLVLTRSRRHEGRDIHQHATPFAEG